MELPSKVTQSIENALYIEHHVQRIITEQEIRGVYFNSPRARFYLYAIRDRKIQLELQIRPYLSLHLQSPYNTPVSRPFKRDGTYTSIVKSWYEGEAGIADVSGPFTRVCWKPTDLGSRAQVTTALIERGWKPTGYTPKGSPQLAIEGEPCPNLLRIGDKVGKQIAEWYILSHRSSQIEGWLKKVRPDGRLSAAAITIGTPTFRFRHSVVVNVPRSTSFFGKRLRSLFTTEKGRVLVGFDAAGLELRVLAHYLDDKEYTKEVVHGDIHTRNQEDAGLPTRDDGKTFIYAFNYGAGAAKIGAIIGKGARAGAAIKAKFLSKNPGIAELIRKLQAAGSRGYLIGLDGRRLVLRRDKFNGQVQTHKALNTELQGGGAIVMKWSMVILDLWIREMGLDAFKVIDMHDEAQWDSEPQYADLVGRLGCMSIVEAGKLLNMKLPLKGEYKIGPNWAHTH